MFDREVLIMPGSLAPPGAFGALVDCGPCPDLSAPDGGVPVGCPVGGGGAVPRVVDTAPKAELASANAAKLISVVMSTATAWIIFMVVSPFGFDTLRPLPASGN